MINRDVSDFSLMVGVPARQIGWMSRHGEQLSLPLYGSGEARCPFSDDLYRLDGRVLTLVDS